MKTALGRSITVLVLIILRLSVRGEDYTYMIDNGTITITKYSGPGGAVTIPSMINGLQVTCVGDAAFSGSTNVTSIAIPIGVTSIGNWAFFNCTSPTHVAIPDSITIIGEGAFYGLTNLTSIKIPDHVTSIERSAFSHCTSLTNLTIGTSVTNIDFMAFASCTRLTSVTIPDNVTGIAGSSLSSQFDAGAFVDCVALTDITIGTGVGNIGRGAFYGCLNLTAINVDPRNAVYSSVDGILFDKGRATLIECPNGRSGNYILPVGVTNIGEQAFYLCARLTAISVPDSVSSIGYLAFGHCSGLATVRIGSGVTSIGDLAFFYCTSLEGAYFQGNAPAAPASAFSGDANVMVYYLPGTTGWGSTFGDRPTAVWLLPNPVILYGGTSFGIRSNAFGFTISWATNVPVVVETSETLTHSSWSAISTNSLTNGSCYFSDLQWTNYPGLFYRVRSF